MEQALGTVAFWIGLNFEFLVRAASIALVAGLVATIARRRDHTLARVLALGSFFAAFGWQVSVGAAGWATLLSENPTHAAVARLFVLIGTGLAVGVMVALRSRPRFAGLAAIGLAVVIGLAVPVTREVVPHTRGLPDTPPPESTAPSGYPQVSLWVRESEGFGAMFPTPPSRLGVSSVDVEAYAWQSQFEFDDGGALASVYVARVGYDLDSASQRAFLLSAHRGFLQSVGADTARAQLRWATMAAGRPVLHYEARYAVEGVQFTGKGFWVFDRQRVLRVSSSIPEALSANSAAVAQHFPRTFMLLSERTRNEEE